MTKGGPRSKVLLYELNEVPWTVVDRYVAARPNSALAGLVSGSRLETTVNKDSHHLQPWRTWPTFHKGLYADDHNSFELGQDPSTFKGDDIWTVAAGAGRKVGVFGPLQSWPATDATNGGFYVPDTFARSPETFPAGLERFQRFNLAMTRENAFSARAPISSRDMLRTGVDVLGRGLTPWAMSRLVRQLARERRDERWKAARPMAQVLLSFDLFWRLHRSRQPDLSVFFTNHVAGMMHRYWGDAMPEYTSTYDYVADDIFGSFVFEAMDLTDRHLAKIRRWVDKHPDTQLVIASSMGQDAIPPGQETDCIVVRDAQKLATALGLGSVEAGLAMYPKTSLLFESPEAAEHARAVLKELKVDDDHLFQSFHVDGVTLSFGVRATPEPGVDAVSEPTQHSFDELGLNVEARLGGGNTAHHIPEGILLTYGASVTADDSRSEVEATELAPRLLSVLGVDVAAQALSQPAA